MKKEFKQRLIDWKYDVNRRGQRGVFLSNNPAKEGEYLIKISESITISVEGKRKEVVVSKRFQTFAQTDNDLPPQGDIFRLMRFFCLFANDFDKNCKDTFDELLKDNNNIQ